MTPAAIVNHYHGPQFHFYGPEGEQVAVRAIRQAIPRTAGDPNTEE